MRIAERFPQSTRTSRRRRDLLRRVFVSALLAGATSAFLVANAADGDTMTDWGSSGRMLLQLGMLDDLGTAIAALPGGKLLFAGTCHFSSDKHTLCVARLRADGQFDLGYGPNENGRILLNSDQGYLLGNFDVTLGGHGLALQSDSRAILGGSFPCSSAGDCTGALLIRLDANGIPEPTAFSIVAYANNTSHYYNTVEAVAITPDGKIVAAGCTTRAGSNPPNFDFGVARVNADFTPDTSFGSGGYRVGAFDLGGDQYDCANAVIVLPDRKIVAAGWVTGTDGRMKAGLMKLNVDGSMDAAFGNNGRAWFDRVQWSPGNIGISAIALDRRGRLVVAGSRSISDSADTDFFVARLDATTGALDAMFNGNGVSSIPIDLAAPFTDTANDLLVQGDGRILVAGHASADANTSAFVVARVDDDGVIDETFGYGGKIHGSFSPPTQTTAPYDDAFSMAIADGGLFLAGFGREQFGGKRFGVAKLQLDAIFGDGFER